MDKDELATKISECDTDIKKDIKRGGIDCEKAEDIVNTGLHDKWPSDKGYGNIAQEKYEHTTLDTLIRQDVEHGTFRAQNCFDEEYLTPQFYKYAKGLEKEVEFLKAKLKAINEVVSRD